MNSEQILEPVLIGIIFALVAGMTLCCMIYFIRCFKKVENDQCGWECCGTLHGGWMHSPKRKEPTLTWELTDSTIDARRTTEVNFIPETGETKTVIKSMLPNKSYRSFAAIQTVVKQIHGV